MFALEESKHVVLFVSYYRCKPAGAYPTPKRFIGLHDASCERRSNVRMGPKHPLFDGQPSSFASIVMVVLNNREIGQPVLAAPVAFSQAATLAFGTLPVTSR